MDYGRNLIVSKAREFLGTPYHHQGRVKGGGVDCAGLVICVAHELGLSAYDINNYPRKSDGIELKQLFNKNAILTKKKDIGNIILLQIKQVPQHCGIMGIKDDFMTLIHACRKRKKVVEIELTQNYINQIVSIYKSPNLDKI